MKFCKFIAFILILSTLSAGCGILRFNDPVNKAHIKEKRDNKKAQKAYRAEIKEQYKIQSEDTRKRMKKNWKKAKKSQKTKKKKSGWKCT
ncbi:MAG: hypothetical protein R2764_09110 [Bacteroidales bacterium]